MHVHVRVPVSVPHIIHSLLVLVCAMSVEAKNKYICKPGAERERASETVGVWKSQCLIGWPSN